MNKILKFTFVGLTILYCLFSSSLIVNASTCNWKSQISTTSFWDSCTGKKYKYSLNGFLSIKSSSSCYIYEWSVNGLKVGTKNLLNYQITSNGAYIVCIKITDTCNKCDTTICSTRNVTCISSICNWKSRTPAVGHWDSCSGKTNKYSISAYIYFTNYFYKSCLKYQWTVNGKDAGKGKEMNFPITSNGTYIVCVKVSDTCNYCDTTYCTTRTFTCVGSTSKCNWKSRSATSYFWDTCNPATKQYSINGSISFKNSSCFKYEWTVNGSITGKSSSLHYPIPSNNNYTLCVKVIDTCNTCDTSFCSTSKMFCMPTAIKAFNKQNVLKVSPNPSNGVIRIDLGESASSYSIKNITGEMKFQGNLRMGINILDFANQEAGFYFLQVQFKNKVITEKILILSK